MFTGIVEQIGTVAQVTGTDRGLTAVIAGSGLGAVPIGASIAINGVCLTVVGIHDDTLSVDIIPETLRRSNLGSLTEGTRVNLERPMPANGRFDGHIVQGHVDGLGTIATVDTASDGGVVMTVRVPGPLRRYIVEKGSVTIDGVSLTVSDVTDDGFTVALIPHTLEVTTLGLRKPDEQVNLEMDVLAKYVERLMKQ